MKNETLTEKLYPNIGTAVWGPAGIFLGAVVTLIVFKCYHKRRSSRKLNSNTQQRQDSFYQENAVYWDSNVNGRVDLADHRRTETVNILTNKRSVSAQTDIDSNYMDRLEREYQPVDNDIDCLSMAPPPPPPIHEDPLPLPNVPVLPRRMSKDDCIPHVPSYRKSNVPCCLQNLSEHNPLSASGYMVDVLDQAFKDQYSPLHQRQDHYLSVPSVVLIPNSEDAPPPCHDMGRHSYINLKKTNTTNISIASSLNASLQMVDYENTKIWVKPKENDDSDDDTHVDCTDKQFQDCVRNTLRRQKERASQAETEDQYSAFASLTAPQKPERPRTGYVVMELTEEVMSFLKVREKQGERVTASAEIQNEIYYDDRVKQGYLSMYEQKNLNC